MTTQVAGSRFPTKCCSEPVKSDQQSYSHLLKILGGLNIFYFHPYLGKWSKLTNIFQMGGSTTNQFWYVYPDFALLADKNTS